MNYAELETYANDLANTVKHLTANLQNSEVPISLSNPFVSHDAPSEFQRARKTILANISRIRTILSEPKDFLQTLASQSQLLACVQWLGEFQILACIPLSGSVPIKDIAELSGVPESQLRLTVRMTATAGFLQEPEPGKVAHTSLSAPFVTRPLFLDAAMFLAKSATPAALQMAAATRKFGHSDRPQESAYSLAFNTLQSFDAICEQKSGIQRQWTAYERFRHIGDGEDTSAELLSGFDWPTVGRVCIVEISAAASSHLAAMLAERYPTLQFILQCGDQSAFVCALPQGSNGGSGSGTLARSLAPPQDIQKRQMQPELSSRIERQKRIPGSPQIVKDAAIYLLPLPSPSPRLPSQSLLAKLTSELRAHLEILRKNTSATIIAMLPESDTINQEAEAEAEARQRELTLLQLANDRNFEVGKVKDVLGSIWDSNGRLRVINQLRSQDNRTVALVVKYQPFSDIQQEL